MYNQCLNWEKSSRDTLSTFKKIYVNNVLTLLVYNTGKQFWN